MRGDLGGDLGHPLGVGHVGHPVPDRGPGLGLGLGEPGAAFGRRGQFLGLKADQGHAGPQARERLGQGGTDAAGRAGHHCGLARQVAGG